MKVKNDVWKSKIWKLKEISEKIKRKENMKKTNVTVITKENEKV